MSQRVDELFGGGDGAPEPRTGAIVAMLVVGVTVATLGLACTSVPGGVIVLMAWMMAEKEVDRIDNGYLPNTARPTVVWLQRLCVLAVFLTLALFILQAWLFCSGQYDVIWSMLLEWVVGAPA